MSILSSFVANCSQFPGAHDTLLCHDSQRKTAERKRTVKGRDNSNMKTDPFVLSGQRSWKSGAAPGRTADESPAVCPFKPDGTSRGSWRRHFPKPAVAGVVAAAAAVSMVTARRQTRVLNDSLTAKEIINKKTLTEADRWYLLNIKCVSMWKLEAKKTNSVG